MEHAANEGPLYYSRTQIHHHLRKFGDVFLKLFLVAKNLLV